MFAYALPIIRLAGMALILCAGYVWLTPRDPDRPAEDVRFIERAEASGCGNAHTMVRLADDFENIMPWLSSVGAAVAAADYDNDGDADLYVTNSGRGDRNRLLRNRGDGTFEDVTDSAGVGCGNPEGGSMHAIWGDIDNDDDLDLYVTKWAEPNQLFRNDGQAAINTEGGKEGQGDFSANARFTDISSPAGVDYWGYGNGATFLDYDRDGKLDILVGNYFAEKVEDPKTGEMVLNNLWKPVTTRVMHETFTHARNGGHNVLYRNRGDGSFEDVSESVGLTHTGWTLSVGSGDLNNDGWPDLYVANDFGPDELYLNTGATEQPPRFRLFVDPKGHPGVGNDWWKGMNVDMADVNNDGWLDIYVTNILEKRYKTDEGNMLWLNCPDADSPIWRCFKNVALQSGTFDGGWGWGGKFADFNNDGLLDIYTVNGFATGDPDHNYWFAIQEMVTQTKNQTIDARDWPVMGTRDLSGYERGRLFMQTAREDRRGDSVPHFVESAEAAGVTDRYNGRGIALADFNLDGWLDMYVANQGAPSTYYVNVSGDISPQGEGGEPGFLRLTLKGSPQMANIVGDRPLASTRDAVGARVIVAISTATVRERASTHSILREVQGGMGFASQSEFALHFGIPPAATVEQVHIQWPSGREQTFDRQAAQAMLNQHVKIEEAIESVAWK